MKKRTKAKPPLSKDEWIARRTIEIERRRQNEGEPPEVGEISAEDSALEQAAFNDGELAIKGLEQ